MSENFSKLYERCGSPCYVAPEILRDQGYNTNADIFSLGSLMFNLLTGRFLFSGKDKYEILNKNKIWIKDEWIFIYNYLY